MKGGLSWGRRLCPGSHFHLRLRLRQAHADQLADATLFHRHAVKNVGLRYRGVVVSDDDELSLRQEPILDLV
jgi:hypothetical protein